MSRSSESWNSRIGVILAVAGSAVGLGNFLRFPGQAAQYGGGAFMLAYFISLLLIGIPICWVEWTMGRFGGKRGLHSSPGILGLMINHPAGKYVGVLGVIIPVVIYMYYVYIEAWCLGYAVNFAAGKLNFGDNIPAYGQFWGDFIGIGEDGGAVGFGFQQVGIYLLLVFILNFYLIFRGLSKGIELFCRYAMPLLVGLAVIILIRVLTLGAPVADKPEQNLVNGLGYMWNPTKYVVQTAVAIDGANDSFAWESTEIVGQKAIIGALQSMVLTEEALQSAMRDIGADEDQIAAAMAASSGVEKTAGLAQGTPLSDEADVVAVSSAGNHRLIRKTILSQLSNPQLWLAAAGQIFFSLSVGFGVIITYASYLSEKDDIVLSGLSATSANEFCEVALGGLISIPAGFMFLGVAGIAGQGTFGLGFNVLPIVFSKMAFGSFFGFLFFFLLFLAAVTSSLSMLQPGIAFLEEAIPMNRKQSVALLGMITAMGCLFVVYASKDIKALDTIDFWVGTFLIFVLATIQVIVFGWRFGIDRGWEEAHRGAEMRIPKLFRFIIKYVSPLYLLAIFLLFVLFNIFGWDYKTGEFAPTGYVADLIGTSETPPNKAARLSVVLVASVGVFLLVLIGGAKKALAPKDKS